MLQTGEKACEGGGKSCASALEEVRGTGYPAPHTLTRRDDESLFSLLATAVSYLRRGTGHSVCHMLPPFGGLGWVGAAGLGVTLLLGVPLNKEGVGCMQVGSPLSQGCPCR